ncbi:hypothetical protein [Pinibacter aurantiacus]|uniref:Uncharacterized protein n=1 Tax=Pinibacter aurantiacus TaxID=2851599 RepID=A0A9E2W728_9BACT|nr:hypothetical protein [Pinibacter aurantiacus]MBV4360528.1 hypothetical protein [Pinibacter aurantiacus]
MFGSVVLEVAIGIIFMFMLSAMICTAVREGIESKLKTRAAYLERGIRELLHDRGAENIARSFFEHPLINGLYTGEYSVEKKASEPKIFESGKNLPSYIPSKNFALTLMDIAARGRDNNEAAANANSTPITVESVRANISKIGNVYVQRAFLTALDSAQGDLNLLQQNLEDWFNSSMDRISGWYKRSTQYIIFFIGLVLAVGLNINTLSVADYLFHNDDERKIIVTQAEAVVKDSTSTQKNYRDAAKALASIKIPIGWNDANNPFHGFTTDNKYWLWQFILMPLLGWLITAFAATLGAPFWFDLLNKVMVIRSTVKPTEKSGDEGSEDRRSNKQQPVIIGAGAPAGGVQQHAAIHGATHDSDSNADFCDVVLSDTDATPDEDLPLTLGGVQQ